jgi:glycosyltransferase involved in cell wall biosynthesis
MGPIDVVMLTKNSQRLLRACLSSVYRNVPVNNLIVIDGYSTDATLGIVGEFHRKYGNVTVVQDGGTRGTARQIAIGKVKTDWFMFVDSDVILCQDWFAKAEKIIKDNVGAVWGIEIWSVLRNTRLLKLFERITMKIFEKRGGTHDLLVRSAAVKDILIPFYLNTYEDFYIKSWICGKGYVVIATYDPYCIHYRPESAWTVKQSISFVASDLRLAFNHPSLMLSYMFYTAIVIGQNLMRTVKNRRLD